MNRKTRALLLTALVLPGLGQLYLGRKLTGIALIMLLNLLLLLALFVLLKASSPLLAAVISSSPVNGADILTALHGVAGYGRMLLAAFALLWGFAIADIIRTRLDDAE